MVEQNVAEGGNAILLEEVFDGFGGKGVKGGVGWSYNMCVFFN